MKTCTKCGISKPLFDFQGRKEAKDGHRTDCRQCSVARVKANYLAKHEHMKAMRRRPEVLARNVVSKRKALTGFCPELYERAKALQDWRCAICGTDLNALPDKHVHADHCHKTRTPRGVLCHWCNVALGQFKDDPERLKSAIRYLENPPARFT